MSSRYCILSGIYPPDTGGPAKFANTFSQFLIKEENQVRVISYTSFRGHTIKRENLIVELISRKLPIPIRYARMVFSIFKAVMRKERIVANGCFIELIILRTIFPFSYTAKVPGDIVWERARNSGITFQNIDKFQTQSLGWKYRIFRHLFTRSLLKSQHIIVPSTHLKKLVASWGVPINKISLVYNSIDTSKFLPVHQEMKIFDVITVSRLVAWKNIDEVINVCSSLGLSLAIVGDGPLRESLELLSRKLNSQVTFFGNVQQDKLINLLQQASVYALNSDFEATSYALIEAMSCGVVPVSNESTGSSEVIENGVNGILCGVSSGQNLKAALEFIFSDSNRYRSMSKNARLRVMNDFNVEVNFKVIRALADD